MICVCVSVCVCTLMVYVLNLLQSFNNGVDMVDAICVRSASHRFQFTCRGPRMALMDILAPQVSRQGVDICKH